MKSTELVRRAVNPLLTVTHTNNVGLVPLNAKCAAMRLVIKVVNFLLNRIEETYNALIEAGVAKECARMILPECTQTTLTFNGSLRSWLSFLNVRCDHHAQKEIQELATLVGEILEQEMPKVFSSINWKKGMFM